MGKLIPDEFLSSIPDLYEMEGLLNLKMKTIKGAYIEGI